jgi:hypothetical protein
MSETSWTSSVDRWRFLWIEARFRIWRSRRSRRAPLTDRSRSDARFADNPAPRGQRLIRCGGQRSAVRCPPMASMTRPRMACAAGPANCWNRIVRTSAPKCPSALCGRYLITPLARPVWPAPGVTRRRLDRGHERDPRHCATARLFIIAAFRDARWAEACGFRRAEIPFNGLRSGRSASRSR